MFPAARLVVHLRPFQAHDIEEQAFGQAMLAQDLGRPRAPLVGQLQAPITHHMQEPITLHARDRLGNRRPRMPEAVDDARAQRRHPVLLKLENGFEVHLGGVDQVCHDVLLHMAYRPLRIGRPFLK